MDAPSHFSEKGAPADEVPPASFVGPAWVLDARAACAKDPDHLVSKEDFAAALSVAPLPERAIVLVLTGWGRYWPGKKAYLGDDRPGKTDALSFPGIDPELARVFVIRRVRAVGIDTASIDRGQSKTFESHQVLGTASIPTFENVANLDAVPRAGAWIVAAPMKIEGGTGAPLRLYALVSGEPIAGALDTRDPEAVEAFSRLAPTEAEISAVEGRFLFRIAPAFLSDSRRGAELQARLERAAFYVDFRSLTGADAWKAPEWPVPHRHALEHGTPEERMARYEEPGRDTWQKPDDVIKALELKEDAASVDVGVGSGYFARRMAAATPKGKAIGIDIEPEFVEHVNAWAKEHSLPNLEARLTAPDDPGLPAASTDLVLVVDTFHHLGDRRAYLGKLRSALRPGGRIVIIDFKKTSKMGPPAEHKLSRDEVIEDAKAAHLVLSREHDFLPEQYFLEFRAP